MNAPATIGDNLPPDPFLLFNESINDLLIEANNYLDGKAIENEDQEAAVASILTRLRRETGAADDQRKAEKKPHDDAGKEVQAKWQPLLRRAEIGVECAKSALSAFLRKKEAAQRAAAQAAIEEARKQAEAAAQAAQQARPGDMADQTTARILQENAADAQKRADKLGKAKVQAKGGERAVGLRTTYRAEITDATAFVRWVWANRRDEMAAFLAEVAARESRSGPRGIPGIIVHEDREAV